LNLPFPARDLIPQKGRMGFEQMLIKTQKDDGRSTAVIGADHILLDDYGQLSNSALIEYVNQLIAATQGYNALAANEPAKKGFFVGVQDATFWETVHTGDLLTLKKYLLEEVAQVNFVQGIILREGQKIAELVTKIYEVRDLVEFDSLTGLGSTSGQNGASYLNNRQSPSFFNSNLHRKLYSYLCELKISADQIVLRLACPQEFEAFDGHFPGRPILPGIILLEIASMALEIYTNRPMVLKQIKKMKISSVVLPDRVIEGTVKVDSRDSMQLDFSAVFKGENNQEISRLSGTTR
jgi:3-hydroxymyristoyl/3-hydroxydecanoyl-(acyl carrier protein) dehydratase